VNAVRQFEIPEELLQAIKAFSVDRRTGNVQLNFQDGRLLGLRVEQIIRLKPGN
jgi:hypothetical protein